MHARVQGRQAGRQARVRGCLRRRCHLRTSALARVELHEPTPKSPINRPCPSRQARGSAAGRRPATTVHTARRLSTSLLRERKACHHCTHSPMAVNITLERTKSLPRLYTQPHGCQQHSERTKKARYSRRRDWVTSNGAGHEAEAKRHPTPHDTPAAIVTCKCTSIQQQKEELTCRHRKHGSR